MSHMHGFLQRTADGRISAVLHDTLGYVTHIVGVPATQHGVRGYALTATVVAPEPVKPPVDDGTAA